MTLKNEIILACTALLLIVVLFGIGFTYEHNNKNENRVNHKYRVCKPDTCEYFIELQDGSKYELPYNEWYNLKKLDLWNSNKN